MGLEFRGDFTEWFSHGIVGSMSAAATVSSAWLGLHVLLMGWLTLMPIGQRPQFFTGCWQVASGPCHRGFSIGLLECPYDMAAGFPKSKLSKKAKGSHNVLSPSFRNHIPSFSTHCTSYTSYLYALWEGTIHPEGTIPGDRDD